LVVVVVIVEKVVMVGVVIVEKVVMVVGVKRVVIVAN
jgi:hypothetical protein